MRATILKSISGREFKVTSNKSKRIFTIKEGNVKYRTLPMSREDFENAEYWTGNDWVNFLKTDEYFVVK